MYEFNEGGSLFRILNRIFDFLNCLGGVQVRPVHYLVHFLDASTSLGIQFVALESHRVWANASCGAALNDHVGRHIFGNTAHTANEGHRAEDSVLVHAGQPSKRYVVFNVDMATQAHAVRHNHAISEVAIVSDVGTGHVEPTVANCGGPVLVFFAGHGTGADGGVLTKDVAISDDRAADKPFAVFEVLGQNADLCAAEEVIVFADDRSPIDDAVGADDCAGADSHVLADD